MFGVAKPPPSPIPKPPRGRHFGEKYPESVNFPSRGARQRASTRHRPSIKEVWEPPAPPGAGMIFWGENGENGDLGQSAPSCYERRRARSLGGQGAENAAPVLRPGPEGRRRRESLIFLEGDMVRETATVAPWTVSPLRPERPRSLLGRFRSKLTVWREVPRTPGPVAPIPELPGEADDPPTRTPPPPPDD
ncbi:protein E6C [Equid gammaherpesvirus 2]|nr:protein E6C [Equid gammaherpesvirus 2]